MKQEIEFRDPVVQSVVNKFVDRSDVGFAKYGKTLRDDQSDVFTWLNHLQEELMDATLYLQRLKEEISTLREEKALLNEINDIDVIDAFEVPSKKKNSKNIKTHLEERLGPGGNSFYSLVIDDDEEDYIKNQKYMFKKWQESSTGTVDIDRMNTFSN
jgi:hypothetical protein